MGGIGFEGVERKVLKFDIEVGVRQYGIEYIATKYARDCSIGNSVG